MALLERVAGLPCFESASSLFGYVAIGPEAVPRALLERGARSAILVPAMTAADEDPQWCEWTPGAGATGSRESRSLAAIPFPAVVLVPGVGFDHAGMRLGRGRGFYDRALAVLRRAGEICAVGLSFESQIVPQLPGEPWDQRMDYVVSESRVIAATDAPLAHILVGSR